jgi:hypothetical protein
MRTFLRRRPAPLTISIVSIVMVAAGVLSAATFPSL